MSRRYGRNQKRRAREAQAALTLERDVLTGLLADQRAASAQLRAELSKAHDVVDEFIERLFHALGEDSGLIPWVKHRAPYGPYNFIPSRWHVPPRTAALFRPAPVSAMDLSVNHAIDLYELALRLERRHHDYAKILRVLVKHPLYDEFHGHAAILIDRGIFDRRGLSARDVDMLFDMYRGQIREFIADGGMFADGGPKESAP